MCHAERHAHCLLEQALAGILGCSSSSVTSSLHSQQLLAAAEKVDAALRSAAAAADARWAGSAAPLPSILLIRVPSLLR